MSVFDEYRSRINAKGSTERNAMLNRESRFITNKLQKSLSYHQLSINGTSTNAAVINTDNMDTKILCSVPGADLPHGGIVEWMNNRWLITERDANNEIYTKCKMRQCNYLLKWVDSTGSICERWCVIEDGTKYMTGEYGDNDYVITKGDSRVAMIIQRDEKTVCFNRENRFLIDDYSSPSVLAYRLSKPFKLSGSYNNAGVLCFVLQECNTEDNDNIELHIANYYDYFPRTSQEDGSTPNEGTEPQESGNTRRWL